MRAGVNPKANIGLDRRLASALPLACFPFSDTRPCLHAPFGMDVARSSPAKLVDSHAGLEAAHGIGLSSESLESGPHHADVPPGCLAIRGLMVCPAARGPTRVGSR